MRMAMPTACRLAVPAGLVPSMLWAEPVRAPSWELEVHGGFLAASRPTGGTGSLPAPGPGFTTISGSPSRRESSWYFGDGASLFNEVNARLGGNGRIVALDPVLRGAALERPGG